MENSVILLGACIPTLRPLLTKVFSRFTVRNTDPENSHQLVTFSNLDMFAPKAQRHWNPTMETEFACDTSDDQSDRGIVRRVPQEIENAEIVGNPSQRHARVVKQLAPSHLLIATMTDEASIVCGP